MATASKLQLEVPVGYSSMTYEIVRPLMQGSVEIEGVEIKKGREFSGATPPADSPLKTGDFGIYDLNIAFWLGAIDKGWDVIGLPLFVKRKSAYWYMIVRNDRGIATPKDLEGKLIATQRFHSAVVTWCRGLLQDRHHVDTSTFRWLVSEPGVVFPVYDTETQVEFVTDGRTGVRDQLTRLLEGEIDAFIADISDVELFGWVKADPRISYLFPDYMEEDYRLWREMGIFTPMHTIVLSGRLNREHPELALRIYDAFQRSKDRAHLDILRDRSSFSVIYLREYLDAQFKKWGDPFPYGIAANLNTLNSYLDWSYQQGITRKRFSFDEVFPKGVLGT